MLAALSSLEDPANTPVESVTHPEQGCFPRVPLSFSSFFLPLRPFIRLIRSFLVNHQDFMENPE